MIMRTWRGAVRALDAERYLTHQASTGVREYRQTPGNTGVLVIRRTQGDLCEVTTVSFWESMESVRRFAGEDPDRARRSRVQTSRSPFGYRTSTGVPRGTVSGAGRRLGRWRPRRLLAATVA